MGSVKYRFHFISSLGSGKVGGCMRELKEFSGPEQSMKIDDRKINRSIDDNRLITVD